jgi:hypothetical protein
MVFAALTTDVVGLTDLGNFVMMFATGDMAPSLSSTPPTFYSIKRISDFKF